MDIKSAFWGILFVVVVIGAVFVLDVVKTPSEPASLKQLNSVAELSAFLNKSQNELDVGGMHDTGIRTLAAPTVAAEKSGDTAGATTADFSQTNIQVAGVDEPDVVKTDGTYIYTRAGSNIVIVRAVPATDAQVVSNITLPGTVNDFFVNGNKLIAFGYDNYPIHILRTETGTGTGEIAPSQAPVAGETVNPPTPGDTTNQVAAGESFARPDFYPRSSNQAFIFVYDITDRTNPTLARNITLDGSYVDSRMIDNEVYVIVHQQFFVLGTGNIALPTITSGGKTATLISDVNTYYFDDMPDYNYQFTTVVSLDVQNDGTPITTKSFLSGYTSTIYVSQKNIYTTSQKYVNYRPVIFEKTMDALPTILPADLAAQVKAIRESGKMKARQYQEITPLIQNYQNSLSETARTEFETAVQRIQDQINVDLEKEYEKTVIHRIAIENGNIEPQAEGEVPGHLLNQFSLDESNGYLRVATTTSGFGQNQQQKNHVYVLDAGLVHVGALEDIAPGESIYAARFLGSRLYLVTFKRIDPLFVIDLADPANPKILGKLK
ncbi:MAG: beta-propeller domain-containing protein, partial [Candidatus Aenigmarchaeota archaeon]|nr:beta-propeller domain-containing protein [Candidatus Aenigmarchaeota archaeon]